MPKAKIMIAEDDPTMVGLLRTLLKMEGYEVLLLDASADVVAQVRSQQPDALLLDVHLSQRSGLDILDSLHASGGTAGTRVVMVSGLNLKEECLRHGADSFLLKPFMPDDLIQVLRKHVKSA
jgi:CheY-like chemotaxis protein